MAAGDVHLFQQAKLDMDNKVHNMASDVFKIGLVSAATVPSVSTAAPHWGGTGTTNFATNQVSTAGTSYTGPVTLANQTSTIVSGKPSYAADNVTWAQDASGPTNIAYGVIYNNTDANKRAIGFIELSAAAAVSLVSGPLTIKWNNGATNGVIFQDTIS